MEAKISDFWRDMVVLRQRQRDWQALPPDYERTNVHNLYLDMRKHFNENAVRARIAASKVQTFDELLACLA